MSRPELARIAAELDDTEAAALAGLGERDKWPVDHLPPEIDADVLRCLDVAGLVEACSVILVNQQKHPGDKTLPAPSQRPWFSPIQCPEMAGGWDGIRSAPSLGSSPREPSRVDVSEVPTDDLGGFFPKRLRRIVSVWVPKPAPSFYVRLSERGRAELARRRRRERPAIPSTLTVTQAAKQLQDVVSGLSLESARAEVSSAATARKFETNGKKGPSRRIDRHSFSSWLLERQRKHLDSLD